MYVRVGVCILLVSISSELFAEQALHVPPTAVLTWDEIVRADQALRPSEAKPPLAAIPFSSAATNIENSQAIFSVLTLRDAQGQRIEPDSRARTTCTGCPGDPTLAESFPALLDNLTVRVPDTMGAIGPNHVMTMLNSQIRIQTKMGATLSTVSSCAFWDPAIPGPSCGGGDPKLVYDVLSGRWIAVAGSGPPSSILLAVSTTDDPTGTWTFYQFVLDQSGATVADFHTLGVNSTWIAFTTNVYSNPDFVFQGPEMWVVDKSTALSGGTLTVTFFAPGFDGNVTSDLATLAPCVTADPTEAALYIVNNAGLDPSDNTNMMRLSRITGIGPNPVWSVVPGSIYPGTGLFRVANVFNLTPRPGANCGGGGLELHDARFTSNTLLRNGRIWAVHHGWLPATGTADRTAAFWYQIDPAAMPNPLVQSGVIDGGPGVHHMFPSVAANCADDACIGFSRSSATICPEAVFTARLVADAPGTTRALRVIKVGEGPYFYSFRGGAYRWGDYSATVVDPLDGRTFWTIQEYTGPEYYGPFGGGRRWGTWWGKVSQDCNLNGIPDLCEANIDDCNHNGISDACECCHGDVNGDGAVNGGDIGSFVAALMNQPACAGPDFLTFCRADVNRDGVLGLSDVPAFVQQLLSGATCP